MIRLLAILALFAFALTGCVQTNIDTSTPRDVQNQHHLPPPGFPPVSQPVTGQSCGGMVVRQGPECGTGEYCHLTIADQCGAADAPGICRPIPEMCTQQYAPVCGCDGKTYGNECMANGQGVSAAYNGECRS